MKRLILILILLFTAAVCLWPDLHPEKVVVSHYYWQVDMLIHGGYYFLVCLAVLLLGFQKKIIFTGLYLFGFSVLLELLQYFSYNRSVTLLDITDNLVGIIAAMVTYSLYLKISKRQSLSKQ